MSKKADPLVAQAQKFEVQYKNSARMANSLIDSWLGETVAQSNTSQLPATKPSTNSAQMQEKHIRAKDVFKARPARLGVGAKFIPHSQAVNATSSSLFLSKEEIELKSKLEKKINRNGQLTRSNNENRLYTKKLKAPVPGSDNLNESLDSKVGQIRTSDHSNQKHVADSHLQFQQNTNTSSSNSSHTGEGSGTARSEQAKNTAPAKRAAKASFLDELLSSRKKKGKK